MSSYTEERKYNQLLAEYNRLKANYESLADSYEQKQTQWQRKEGYFKNLVDHARILCEEILAKDKKEMRLGSEYSWSKIDTVDLLDKAYYSLKEYNESRTDMMCRVADLAEERANIIEAMQNEIIYLKTHMSASELTENEINDLANNEQTEHQKYRQQSNEQRNSIDYVVEDDTDYDDSEQSNLDTVAGFEASYNNGNNNKVRVNSGREYQISKERINKKMDAKRNAIMTHTSNIEEVMRNINDAGWEIIRIIGKYGICERKKISNKIMDEKAIDVTESKLNTAYKSLTSLGLITSVSLRLPLQPNMNIHDLTANGSKIYTVKFNTNPVLSERIKIIKEHDNEEHGYGIKALLEVLKGKHTYNDLTMETRKKAINLNGNGQYIPDIMGTYNKMPVYFEYERGTHTPKDFENKLDKTILVTKIVNIVVPNADVAEQKILPKIDKYLEHKSKNFLKNVVIRVATIKYINNPNLKLIDNSDWQYVYDLNKGMSVKRNSME